MGVPRAKRWRERTFLGASLLFMTQRHDRSLENQRIWSAVDSCLAIFLGKMSCNYDIETRHAPLTRYLCNPFSIVQVKAGRRQQRLDIITCMLDVVVEQKNKKNQAFGISNVYASSILNRN